ncbi:hypothetical protein V9T40_008495 [Parthenolecanium corni]|uniref:Uncharacterized protein n=1 Tax=Parthenolecanium corni TaxID=536013 RepID=A0AAN9Y771_9HEMI
MDVTRASVCACGSASSKCFGSSANCSVCRYLDDELARTESEWIPLAGNVDKIYSSQVPAVRIIQSWIASALSLPYRTTLSILQKHLKCMRYIACAEQENRAVLSKRRAAMREVRKGAQPHQLRSQPFVNRINRLPTAHAMYRMHLRCAFAALTGRNFVR